ncbi:DUF2809 domain-containing protein [Oscillatoria sp. FACHB-1407]|uniref:ribosomal maturation YjgA family protein n=1 Tax=Oscillatoria sp. FACHB-1407 TaxID=2692847 RepID=UPI001685DCF7|nr:DUF2809 domain-containing protein [Oscillatoria sp. FACHB-1407]MBD2463236.1 DUF2809 domain-containing protein [Oscillatoria sp. FACHB-1407]
MKFNPHAFCWFLILFALEVAIALFIKDRLIRPLVGDVLVILLIFYGMRSLFPVPTMRLAIGTLIFAWAIEIAQYFRFVERLGLADNPIARVALGTTFDWFDVVAYAIGAIVVVLIERTREKHSH